MTERRRVYAERIRALGLSTPDERTMHLLWQIVDGGALGASLHVRLTLELLTHLMDSADDPTEGWARTSCAGDFIAGTRGSEAPVIANSIGRVLRGLNRMAAAERRVELGRRAGRWQEEAERRHARLVDTAVRVIGPNRRVIAFDYSSTVDAVVVRLAATAPPRQVIVPESRSLAGGRRYVEAFTAAGIPVHYVVDAAFEHILGDDTVILLGAESLQRDGSLINTIGSRPLARLARWRGCPVYGCADLLKLDLRTGAVCAERVQREFDHLLKGIELPNGAVVTTAVPELEVVPASLITAILTDRGPVPPASLEDLAQRQCCEGKEDGAA
ncbi:MAG: hypothetical protein OXI95_18245 [bacterium]|nr:hypothetical protein [bacterium]MDE0418855.1 hypothetical protein [bacterium]